MIIMTYKKYRITSTVIKLTFVIACLNVLLLNNHAYSSKFIEGYIFNKRKGDKITGAFTTLFNSTTDSIIGYTFTNKDGYFRMYYDSSISQIHIVTMIPQRVVQFDTIASNNKALLEIPESKESTGWFKLLDKVCDSVIPLVVGLVFGFMTTIFVNLKNTTILKKIIRREIGIILRNLKLIHQKNPTSNSEIETEMQRISNAISEIEQKIYCEKDCRLKRKKEINLLDILNELDELIISNKNRLYNVFNVKYDQSIGPILKTLEEIGNDL